MKMKKIITMGLAAIMAVSAMSISAFAAKQNSTENSEIAETITCTAVADKDVAQTFELNIPVGLSDAERDNYIVEAAAQKLNSTSSLTYSTYLKKTNFSVPKNNTQEASTSGPFSDVTFSSDVAALAVKFERRTGNATSYNARFEYVNTSDSNDTRTSYLNRSAASGSCTIYFTDGAACYPDDMIVSSEYSYDLYVSANTSGGKADITLLTGKY